MKNLISNNLFIKLLSIALALLLWLFVSNEQNETMDLTVTETFQDVEVAARNIDPELVMTEEPDNVTVTVAGNRTFINRVSEENLVLYVDLDDLGPGTHQIAVRSGIPQVEVTSIDPAEVEVQLEEYYRSEKQVDVQLIGEPEEGLTPEEVTVSPSTVDISGPKSKIEQIDRISARVDLTGKSSSIQQGIILEVFDRHNQPVENIEIKPGMVEVSVDMAYPSEQVAVNVNWEADIEEEQYIVSEDIQPEKVKVLALESQLEGIDYIETEPVALGEVIRESKEIPLYKPDDIINLEPEHIMLQVEVTDLAKQEFTVPLEAHNVPGDAEVSGIQDTVEVIVFGEEHYLDDFQQQNLTTYLDLEGLDPGTHFLPVLLELDDQNSDQIFMRANPKLIETQIEKD